MRLTPPTRPSFWTAITFGIVSAVSTTMALELAYFFLAIAFVILLCAALFTKT